MTKKELLQYRYLLIEIKELENKIKNYEGKIVTDKVQSSQREFPYTQYELKIQGVEDSLYIKKLREKLFYRIEKCKKLKVDIENFINNIEDSRTRLVFQLRYVEGWSWQRISLKLGSTHESYSRKIHERFFN
ncbi:hypothetical protein QP555_05710 [Peptoniphilus lacrimalis]|uniref:hypothetical protein n=1 Tax=Peptoniphilus lacrimalis TaxID=33031 RepID=UPI00254BFCF6|nr:hypothetical protein [Peptoniphilus lacrimalis]MDK7722505.1 hypothetical protein [Peptoniphilus lacrimalis]MDK7732106.1 hypothetical protein [Peptoniphilus lacrimalis]